MMGDRKRKRWIFPIALLIYALVLLVAIAVGLHWLWDYADAYQKSRPDTALQLYMERLDSEYVVNCCDELIDKIDHNLQSQQQCRQALLQALTEEFTCTKKVSASSENHYVYTIRCGAKVIGIMEMECIRQTDSALVPWQVTKEQFDLSYLLTEPISITVPDHYTVQVFGNTLDKSYITEEEIPYTLLQPFYGQYDMPYMVTYTAGPFIGEGILTPYDASGNPVHLDTDTDMNRLLPGCTQAEMNDLKNIATDFISAYVDFTSRNGGNTGANYTKLCKFMVKDGTLSKKMKEAIESFNWIDDRHGVLQKLDIHQYVNIGQGKYFCDLTYQIETDILYGRETQNVSVQLIFSKTEAGLRAEAMRIL